MVLFISSTLFTDFIIPTWEGDEFVQTAASMSFFNLMFRSIIIIIYGDRCEIESKIFSYFNIDEDMLWVWFEYSIYQLIFFRILGYIALYIQANFEKFNFIKFANKKKNLININPKLKELQENVTTNNVSYDNIAFVSNDENKNEIENIEVENKILQKNAVDQNENFIIDALNEESSKIFAIAWNNLSYLTGTSNNKRMILKHLKGKIDFGTITALMGPSGAGKTTLLQCIYGIQQLGRSIETEFYVNKSIMIQPVFIVQQHKQHLLMNLTVKESLLYSSLLKNHNIRKRNQNTDSTNQFSNQIQFDHHANINQILAELMLTNCSDNKVSQCSGGEQKRLSIGLELTSKVKPNLMCIDEPTSGLDSYAAEQVFLVFSILNYYF